MDLKGDIEKKTLSIVKYPKVTQPCFSRKRKLIPCVRHETV